MTTMQSLSSPLVAPPTRASDAHTGTVSERCYVQAGQMLPPAAWTAAFLALIGLFYGFLIAPSDVHQGDHYRIAFIHLPTLWLSVLIYVLMAGSSAFGLLARNRLAAIAASALAPTGALFAFLALWSGSLWGKPMWNAWWVWDPRLSSELLLLFLFLGFIALQEAIQDPRRADRSAGLLALVGLIGLPLLYFAVARWGQAYGTHARGLSAPLDAGNAIPLALASMTLGLLAYAAAASLARFRNEILARERNSEWVSKLIAQTP